MLNLGPVSKPASFLSSFDKKIYTVFRVEGDKDDEIFVTFGEESSGCTWFTTELSEFGDNGKH